MASPYQFLMGFFFCFPTKQGVTGLARISGKRKRGCSTPLARQSCSLQRKVTRLDSGSQTCQSWVGSNRQGRAQRNVGTSNAPRSTEYVCCIEVLTSGVLLPCNNHLILPGSLLGSRKECGDHAGMWESIKGGCGGLRVN